MDDHERERVRKQGTSPVPNDRQSAAAHGSPQAIYLVPICLGD